jgi:hypothetical protein
MNAYLLEDYLKANAPPRAVILMMTREAWQRGAYEAGLVGFVAQHYPEHYFDLMACVETNRRFLRWLSTGFGTFLPSQRFKYDIRRLFVPEGRPVDAAHVAASLAEHRGNYRYLVQEERERLGEKRRQFSSERPAAFDRNLTRLDAAHLPERFYVSRLNTVHLERFLKTAASRGIPVYIAGPPIDENYYFNVRANEKVSAYLAFLKSIPEGRPGVHGLAEEPYPVPCEQLFDSEDHLSPEASKAYTALLSERIRKLGLARGV